MKTTGHRRGSMNAAIAAAIVSALALLAACNTVQGAGKDIERGGEKVQDAARDVKQRM